MIIVCQLALLYVAWRILFGDWSAAIVRPLHWPATSDVTRARRVALLVCDAVVFARISFMLLVLLQRRMPLGEALGVPLAFAIYYVGFAVMALRCSRPIGAVAIAGLVSFVVGSALNTGAEVQRHLWKRRPEHRGHLYTGGLFGAAMHINYFGDVLWVLGLALVTGNPWALIIPAVLFVLFAAVNGPLLDRHLAAHYGIELEGYRRTTARLVPYVF